jgi:hypothetical protein
VEPNWGKYKEQEETGALTNTLTDHDLEQVVVPMDVTDSVGQRRDGEVKHHHNKLRPQQLAMRRGLQVERSAGGDANDHWFATPSNQPAVTGSAAGTHARRWKLGTMG